MARRRSATPGPWPASASSSRCCARSQRLPAGGEQAALSPDDRTLLLGGRDGSVRFLDLVTGEVRTASGRHDGAVVRAAFSADGRTAVTAGEDSRVIVWDVERAAAARRSRATPAQITGLAISRDAETLYSAALDGKVLIWDLAGDRRLGRPFDVRPPSDGDALSRLPYDLLTPTP